MILLTSIIVPTLVILAYFYATNRLHEFFPYFFGYAELTIDESKGNQDKLSLQEVVSRQEKAVNNYKLIVEPDEENNW